MPRLYAPRMQIRCLAFAFDAVIDWSELFVVPYDSDRIEGAEIDLFRCVRAQSIGNPVTASRTTGRVYLKPDPFWSLVITTVVIEPKHGVLDLWVGSSPSIGNTRRLVGTWEHELNEPLWVRPEQPLYATLQLPVASEGYVAMRGLFVRNMEDDRVGPGA